MLLTLAVLTAASYGVVKWQGRAPERLAGLSVPSAVGVQAVVLLANGTKLKKVEDAATSMD